MNSGHKPLLILARHIPRRERRPDADDSCDELNWVQVTAWHPAQTAFECRPVDAPWNAPTLTVDYRNVTGASCDRCAADDARLRRLRRLKRRRPF